jgi:hypothetical protein
MNIPKDTKGAEPEDVEAHGRYASDVSQGAEQRDTGEDVEAHRRHFFDTDQAGAEEDVEAHAVRQKRDSGEDVEAHEFQRPRPQDGEDPELPRLR